MDLHLSQAVGVVVVPLRGQGREALRQVLQARPRQPPPQHAVLQLLQREDVPADLVRDLLVDGGPFLRARRERAENGGRREEEKRKDGTGVGLDRCRRGELDCPAVCAKEHHD